jgi:hypothetical protein
MGLTVVAQLAGAEFSSVRSFFDICNHLEEENLVTGGELKPPS